MIMVTTTYTKRTFADWMALEETNQIIELIDGDILMTEPLDVHQEVLHRLVLWLASLGKGGTTRFAPSGVYFDQFNTFQPDLFWISPQNSRAALGPDKRVWRGAPDLVVEILSPSTAYRDRGHKFATYEAHGVSEYWLIDPEAAFIEVYRLEEGRYARSGIFRSGQAFRCEVFDGVMLDVTPLFA
jgi:Uma2 family endonuclease